MNLGVHIRADTITAKHDALERLDLQHAVSSLWYLDPPTFN